VNIFVTGATGLVGRRLTAALAARGDRVLALSRKLATPEQPNVQFVVGDPATPGDWLNRIGECDAVIHLAGENIFAKRWTAAFQNEILRSRVDSTLLIANELAKRPRCADGTAKAFLSTSAVGYYGSSEEERTEASPPGNDFMADVCVAWEAAAEPARQAGVRVLHPRLGIVFDAAGGALPSMVRPFRFFAGGPIGMGRQWMSWIHAEDVTKALLFLLDRSDLSGPFNLTSPIPVRNHELAKAIGSVLHRPSWFPVPPIVLRIALGKVAEVLSAGQRVVPKRLLDAGFQFQFGELNRAIESLLKTDL
jgi:uncharacterized protein (TIGR01777 family)